MAEITGICEGDDLDVKRLRLPGLKLKENCPNCKRLCEIDLQDHYLSYPKINAPSKFMMYCSSPDGKEGCEHEWDVPVILRVTLEAIQ